MKVFEKGVQEIRNLYVPTGAAVVNFIYLGWDITNHSMLFHFLVRSLGPFDEDMTKSKGKDPLEGFGGPMTSARARKAKKALQQVLSILSEYKPKFQGEKSKVVSCIMAQIEEH